VADACGTQWEGKKLIQDSVRKPKRRDHLEDLCHRYEVDNIIISFKCVVYKDDRFCGLGVGVLGYRSRGPGTFPSATRFAEK
jgi:hypothetical protein